MSEVSEKIARTSRPAAEQEAAAFEASFVDLTAARRLPERDDNTNMRLRALRKSEHGPGYHPIVGAEWERIPGESQQGYQKFLYFRAMDPKTRSPHRMSKELTVSLSNLHRMFHKYHWASRVAAWDAMLERTEDERERKRLVESALKMRRAQVDVVEAQKIGATALKAQILRAVEIQKNRTDKEGGPDPKALEMLARGFKIATDLERNAVGLPTEVTQQAIALKRELEETMAITEEVKTIISEVLCDACRAKVTTRLRGLSRRQQAVADRLAG